ncbi:MAG TPA: hypothetical protein VES73_15160, partial [Lamprocystis sp. (in: g-proteobacteria)]|nr:hypothetical protein [Lamprocystis sp. (in: g-proteobacteria)]
KRKTIKTLPAIALGIGLVTASGTAWCGTLGDPQGGPRDDPAGRVARMTAQWHLTPDQQAQVRAILEEHRAAVARERAALSKRLGAVLTDAQRAERDARLRQRLDRQLDRLTRRLQLSADQGARIRAVLVERQSNPDLSRAEVKQRIATVLTPEQRKQLDALEQRGNGPGGKGRGPVDGSPDQGATEPGPNR